MSDIEQPNDWLKKNGHKLKAVYSFAVVNKLNIKSQEDVLKILQVLDPENANVTSAKLFTKMLQLFALRFRKTIEKKID